MQATHKRLKLEKEARSTTAKLAKLIITPFKRTPIDWVRFENMFITQVHNKSISAEEKFGNGQSKRTSKDKKPEAW